MLIHLSAAIRFKVFRVSNRKGWPRRQGVRVAQIATWFTTLGFVANRPFMSKAKKDVDYTYIKRVHIPGDANMFRSACRFAGRFLMGAECVWVCVV